MGFSSKEPACQCRRHKRLRFYPWVRKIPLEAGMATHSSILAWRIPRTEEPGGLQSVGSQRVGHGWSDWHNHGWGMTLPLSCFDILDNRLIRFSHLKHKGRQDFCFPVSRGHWHWLKFSGYFYVLFQSVTINFIAKTQHCQYLFECWQYVKDSWRLPFNIFFICLQVCVWKCSG